MPENWNLIGHEWAVDLLRQHVRQGEVRHAYLLAGPAGLGRRTLAIRLAQALNCPTPIAPGEPCLTCRVCRQIEALQHPDLTVIQAESEGGILKVDQIREARRAISLKPYQSPYRVALFLRFQEANENAANALLKTLEEAPSYAVLLLTADNPESLLPTIVSRCEVLRLRPLPLATIEADLIERGLEAEQARRIAHLSEGRPGYARRLASDEHLLETRRQRLHDLLTLLPASRLARFAYAEKLARDKDALRQTLFIWLSCWRDVLLRAAQANTPITNVDQTMQIEFLAGQIGLPTARRVIVELEQAVERLEHNVNPRLLLEVLLLDLPRIY
ncbi:MAG: DNA polymerase III subunit delta' [Anaerolineae bacterium]